MNNIDKTIKQLNTALVLLDAFGDGHEFTMHDYEELAATANELFGGRYSDSNVCYSGNVVFVALARQLKAPVGAFYFGSFGRTYARRHFTKWHLVSDSVGLQG